jgi:tRNA (mo5U34)-methyltransferase
VPKELMPIDSERSTDGVAALRDAVDAHRLWYHVLDLAPGVVTPGWFDLRPVVNSMPWPDVHGKRCLDVGTYDGFLAFELERRGAAEVVATDISDPSGWDLPVSRRRDVEAVIASMAGEKTGQGFDIARQALGSSVERVEISIYDLSPDALGSFDIVVCGSLLLHLRDPLRGLEAIRSVCTQRFLSSETIRPGLGVLHRRRAVAELRGGEDGQWWIPNGAGHRRMLRAAGFAIEDASRPYAIPFGPGHPASASPANLLRRNALTTLMTGRTGVPHQALLAKPT